MSVDLLKADRYLRQMLIADPDRLKFGASVVGAGAIGSVVVIALAKLGMKNIKVFDPDVFSLHNVANQLCLESGHLGTNKAISIANLANSMSAPIEGKLRVTGYPAKIEKEKVVFNSKPSEFSSAGESLFIGKDPVLAKDLFEGIVISCPDCMEARKDVWQTAKMNPRTPYLIDCRMAAQWMQILVVNTMSVKDHRRYEASLISNEDATPEPCGARGIIYTSLRAGASITNIVKRLQLGELVPDEINEDISSGSVTIKVREKTVSNATELALATAEY